jgi:hypothetical protein
MKPLVVLAKGPSAFEVKPNDKVDVATANNALWLCPNPTYAFFNDIELIWLTKKKWFEKVKTIICPTYLHSHWGKLEGICDEDETHFYKLSSLFPNWLDHIDFQVYELHPGDNSRPEEKERTGLENSGVGALDEWPGSTGGTAVSYCSKFLGYRDFILAGFDTGGGYHPIFEDSGHPNGAKGFNGQGTAAQPTHLYQNNWDITVRFAERYGGRVRHINDVSQEEREELGI